MTRRNTVLITLTFLLTFLASKSFSQVPPIQQPLEKTIHLEEMDVAIAYGDGIKIKVLNGAVAQMAFVSISEGSEVIPHNHPEEQITFIKKGKVKFTVDGRDHILGENDMIVVPAYVVHSSIALEDTETVETFGPARFSWRDSIEQ